MEKKENISRRGALKRMSKAAMAVAATTMFPSVNALANNKEIHVDYNDGSGYCEYSNYNAYGNYDNYTNYGNYQNYNDHSH